MADEEKGLVVAVREPDFLLTSGEVATRIKLIKQIYENVMVEGVHYGQLEGCSSPSLYKAGAEKLVVTFRLSVEAQIEDLGNDDEIRYRIKTILATQDTLKFIGCGWGECSSNEDKYKWRKSICNKEYEETDIDRRRLKWKKGTGEAYQVKQVRTSPSDNANTILKMAKKRSLVDGALTCTGASDIFVQDLEDLDETTREHIANEDTPKKTPSKPEVDMPKEKKQAKIKPKPKIKKGVSPEKFLKENPPEGDGVEKLTEKQGKWLYALCKDRGDVELRDVVEKFGYESSKDIPKDEVTKIANYIQGLQRQD